jgi:TolA-binding protein
MRHPIVRRRISRRFVTIILALLGATCGVTATVLACGWSGTTRSVRFNWTTTEREMSRLPRLSADEDTLERDGDNAAGDVYNYEAAAAEGKRNVAELLDVWQRALIAGERGDLAESRHLLRRYLELAAPDVITDWSDRTDADAQIPPDQNSAHDRLDALSALDRGAPHSAIQAYLSARNAYDAKFNANTLAMAGTTTASNFSLGKPGDSVQSSNASPSPTPQDFSAWEEFLLGKDAPRQLDAAIADPRLRDNCDYLRAAILYRADDYTNAAAAFQKLADSYPASEKRDAARYMAGLAWMRASSSYNNVSAADTEACATCQDEAWTRAHAAFIRLTREHARSRFAADARGWLGYLYLRVGRTAEGLAEYYRLLAVEKNKEARFNALTSLSMTRSRATPADAEQLERLLAPEPDIALTYLYHNLYNYTFSYDLAVAEETSPYYLDSSYSDSSWKTYERNRRAAARRETSEGAELRRMARYASELMRRYPRANLAGNFAVRLAEINLELDEHTAALAFANRALDDNVKGDFRAEASLGQRRRRTPSR